MMKSTLTTLMCGCFALQLNMICTAFCEVEPEVYDVAFCNEKAPKPIGSAGLFLSTTQVVVADEVLISKVLKCKVLLVKIRENRDVALVAPQTITEAAAFLSRNINMAYPPTKCVEVEDIFYFSGGISEKPIDDFSLGLAIKKGESSIFEWK